MSSISSGDINMAVSFMTTIVKQTDEDDCEKLELLLKHLKLIKHIKIKLMVESLSVVNWWVYTSYNTHDNCRVHIGFIMSLGRVKVLS